VDAMLGKKTERKVSVNFSPTLRTPLRGENKIIDRKS